MTMIFGSSHTTSVSLQNSHNGIDLRFLYMFNKFSDLRRHARPIKLLFLLLDTLVSLNSFSQLNVRWLNKRWYLAYVQLRVNWEISFSQRFYIAKILRADQYYIVSVPSSVGCCLWMNDKSKWRNQRSTTIFLARSTHITSPSMGVLSHTAEITHPSFNAVFTVIALRE